MVSFARYFDVCGMWARVDREAYLFVVAGREPLFFLISVLFVSLCFRFYLRLKWSVAWGDRFLA